MNRPLSRAARQALVAQLVEAQSIGSQTELAEQLAERGVQVSQGTISKDLLELRAVRRRDGDGVLHYVLPEDEEVAGDQSLSKLVRLCGELLLDAHSSGNLVVVRTPPGAAQYFGSALDRAALAEILGTIAGDDTVLLITADPQGGPAVADQLTTWAAGRRLEHQHEPRPADD